jgi:hypothetical protein
VRKNNRNKDDNGETKTTLHVVFDVVTGSTQTP